MSEQKSLEQILDEEGKTLPELLQGQILPEAPWGSIRPHAIKDRVLLIPELDLVKVGAAFATDDRDTVSQWIDDDHVRAPTSAEYAAFDKYQPKFRALIVQPWVLIQATGKGKPPKLD